MVRTNLRYILWHICWKPRLWSQQRQPLLRNSTVTTRDTVFSMRYARIATSHRNRTCLRENKNLGHGSRGDWMTVLAKGSNNLTDRPSESADSSWETDRSEVAADGRPWWKRGKRSSPHCKPLRSNTEFAGRQTPASEDRSSGTWKPKNPPVCSVTSRQPVKTQQTQKTSVG
jgi:hypothetical protein